MKRLFVLFSLLLFLFSCTTSSPYNRGSLSDAMDKAEDDHQGSRRVPNQRDEPDWGQDRHDNNNTTPVDEAVYAGEGFSGPVYIGIRGGNSLQSAPYFDSIFDTELLIGFREESVEGLLFAGIKAVTAKESSDIYESVDEGVLFLRAGVEGRFYPFPAMQYFSPFLLAQAGGIYMYWSFKNPLEAGGDVITSDSVGGLMLAVGAGISLIDTDVFRLGGACIPETHLFYSETQQGFQNDVFDFYGTVRWAIEAGIKM